MTIRIIAAVLALAALASCSKDDGNITDGRHSGRQPDSHRPVRFAECKRGFRQPGRSARRARSGDDIPREHGEAVRRDRLQRHDGAE